MAEYRLSLRARADLLDIYSFSQANFGQYQADAYHAGFERTFGLLADFPGIGVSADELVPGYRRFRFQSHYIFYFLHRGKELHFYSRADPRAPRPPSSLVRINRGIRPKKLLVRGIADAFLAPLQDGVAQKGDGLRQKFCLVRRHGRQDEVGEALRHLGSDLDDVGVFRPRSLDVFLHEVVDVAVKAIGHDITPPRAATHGLGRTFSTFPP